MTDVKTINSWPPEYKVKCHPRAKRVKLTINRKDGLQITVPNRFNLKNVNDVLIEHKNWIIKHLSKIEIPQTEVMPEKIEFHLLNEIWRIHYMHAACKLELIERPGYEIVLLGNIIDQAACKNKLSCWIKLYAKKHLIRLLKLLSEKNKLPYQSISIRDQKTRWGSCNREKCINLNYRLIFLPENLVSHVILHELCHTKYLNHSFKFWKLLEMYDKVWECNRKALRHADNYIPAWL